MKQFLGQKLDVLTVLELDGLSSNLDLRRSALAVSSYSRMVLDLIPIAFQPPIELFKSYPRLSTQILEYNHKNVLRRTRDQAFQVRDWYVLSFRSIFEEMA